MISDCIYIMSFLCLGVFFVAAPFCISWFFRPRAPSPEKLAPYECGEIVHGTSRVQFNIRFYLFALIFVLFDIEIIFAVPWAVVFREFGMTGYLEMVVFIAVLALGLLYAWKKGALEWQ